MVTSNPPVTVTIKYTRGEKPKGNKVHASGKIIQYTASPAQMYTSIPFTHLKMAKVGASREQTML